MKSLRRFFRLQNVVPALLIGSGLFISPADAAIKVGLVLDKGGKDDKSFNASAYKGLLKAQKKLGVEIKTVEATDDNAFQPLLRAFARKDFDLIIGVGIAQAESIQKVAARFPDKRFAVVDAEVNAPNVKSLLFQEHEGSYLVGALAAMKSKTGKVGFIGGMDIPLIRRFQKGYEAGVKKVNPKAEVIVNYVGVTSSAWNNPPKAKELALSQYSSGADVIFGAAGGSGMGLFDAAEENKKLAIGVDSNQNWIKPGYILTSMVKRVDKAVYDTVEQVSKGVFTPGVARFGLNDQGIDYVVDEHNKKLISPEEKQKLDELKSKIVKGSITVPDYYKM